MVALGVLLGAGSPVYTIVLGRRTHSSEACYCMIRQMERTDIPQVVSVHLASFPGFFLSFLGDRFLAVFYTGICRAQDGIGLVYLDNQGQPAGLLVGSVNPRGFYSRLLRRDWLRFRLASLAALRKRPSILRRLLRAMRYPSKNPAGGDVAGIFSICVSPRLQGSGAGKDLISAFLEEAKRRGSRRVYLTTDQMNNDAVNAFYTNLGFKVERQFVTPEGRRMNEYWIDLT
jgi:ribosomal protein S18 acetylase RimI-like enzyme